MAFTIGSGTFTNGSATVTGVTLTSGTLAYFASGTRMVVGVNPVIQEVEAIAAPTVSTITLRSAWTGTGGTYSFLANQTSEGLRDAVQAIRTNNVSLQSFIDSIDTAATANSVAQRTSDGSINAVNVYASGNVGVGTASPAAKLSIAAGDVLLDNTRSIIFKDSNGDARSILQYFSDNSTYLDAPNGNMVFRGGAGNAERARIDTSGNFGIGTSSPSFSFGGGLHINKSSIAALRLQDASTDFDILTLSGSVFLSNRSNGALALSTNNTERMRIDSSGNVGIGTASPPRRLTVVNSASASEVARFSNERNVSGDFAITTNLGSNCDNTSSYHYIASTGAADKFYILGNGNVQNANNSYGALSDAKLKENIEPASPKLDKLMQVDVVNYNLIGSELKQIGVVAQQLEEVFPSMVDESDDYEEVETTTVDEEGNEATEKTQVPTGTKTKSVKYSVFVPILIKAMQEQQEIIKALEARIEALEG